MYLLELHCGLCRLKYFTAAPFPEGEVWIFDYFLFNRIETNVCCQTNTDYRQFSDLQWRVPLHILFFLLKYNVYNFFGELEVFTPKNTQQVE